MPQNNMPREVHKLSITFWSRLFISSTVHMLHGACATNATKVFTHSVANGDYRGAKDYATSFVL